MTHQSTLFGIEEAYADATDHDRMRAFNADLTPRGMVRQIVEIVASRWTSSRTLRILDPSAGHGVYGSEWLKVRPQDHVIGIEPRVECMDDLRANGYAEIYHGTCQEHIAAIEHVEITITNPPFEFYEEFIELAVPRSEWTVFLGLSSWGHAQTGWRIQPVEQHRVCGRGKFRGETINPETKKKYGADQRDVSHWMWIRERVTRGWVCENLPALPPEGRTWTVPPGTEWRYQ